MVAQFVQQVERSVPGYQKATGQSQSYRSQRRSCIIHPRGGAQHVRDGATEPSKRPGTAVTQLQRQPAPKGNFKAWKHIKILKIVTGNVYRHSSQNCTTHSILPITLPPLSDCWGEAFSLSLPAILYQVPSVMAPTKPTAACSVSLHTML